MLARALSSEWLLAEQQARATLCTTPTQHTKTGLQHDAGNKSFKSWSGRGRLSSLESKRSTCSGGKTNSLSVISAQSYTGTCDKHSWLDKCRSVGDISANRREDIQRTDIFGGSLLDTVCAQHHCAIRNSHILSLLCSAKNEMGVRRNRPNMATGDCGEQPKRVFHNTGHGRSKSKGGQVERCNSIGFGRKSAFRVGVVFIHPRNRCSINTDDRSAVSHQVRGDYSLFSGGGDGGGVGTPKITCPNTPLVSGGGDGGGGAALLDSSATVFLLESCERPMMEKAGEYGNRLSRTSANKMAGASA